MERRDFIKEVRKQEARREQQRKGDLSKGAGTWKQSFGGIFSRRLGVLA